MARRRDRRLAAAAHDRQLAVLGAGLPARDRRVDDREAARLAFLGELSRQPCRRRGVVDEERARRPSRRTRPRRRSSPAARSWSLPTQAITTSAPAAASEALAARLAAMRLDPGPRLFGAAVVDGQIVPGGSEMTGHRGAHHAEAEKCDACHGRGDRACWPPAPDGPGHPTHWGLTLPRRQRVSRMSRGETARRIGVVTAQTSLPIVAVSP